MLEGVFAKTFYMLEGVLLDGDFYMLEGVLANMLRQSARWRPFTCWREC